jgi:hypothetical protein
MGPENAPVIIQASEPGAAAAEDTAQIAAQTDAAVEVAEIEASARVEIAESNNAAAVEIAEAMAESQEIDDEWLTSRFDALEGVLAEMRSQLATIQETLSALAALALSTPTARPAEPPPEVIVETPTEPTPPANGADLPAEKTRVRRLM